MGNVQKNLNLLLAFSQPSNTPAARVGGYRAATRICRGARQRHPFEDHGAIRRRSDQLQAFASSRSVRGAQRLDLQRELAVDLDSSAC